MSMDFLVASLIVIAAPGTGAIFSLAAGLGGGALAGLAAASGCTLAILPHLGIAVAGSTLLMRISPAAFTGLRIVGALYLLVLAVQTLRARGPLAVTAPAGQRSLAGIVGTGLLINLANPKLALFFLAFLPQFVNADAPDPARTMAGLGGVFMLLTWAVFATYGWFAATVLRRAAGRPGPMAALRLVLALALAALAARLVFTLR